jgi:hypothetical protein
MAGKRIRPTKKLKNRITELIIRDASVMAEIICQAVVCYQVQDVKKAFKRFIKSEILESAVHDELAKLPRKH